MARNVSCQYTCEVLWARELDLAFSFVQIYVEIVYVQKVKVNRLKLKTHAIKQII